MRKVTLEQIKPLHDYRKNRSKFRENIMAVKTPRRILVGSYLNFLFENQDTILYQIQEMIHAESIINPEAIQHELNTYNEMIPGPYEMRATLLLEFNDPDIRKVKLGELVGLEKEISLLVDQKHKVFAQYDASQVDPNKLSSVQFLTFPLGKETTTAFLQTEDVEILTTHPACTYRAPLSKEQLTALKEDLSKE